jgi:DNA-binding transcriptional ArsR family regulator
MHLDPFQALAEPTRRSILETLASGERPVNELVAQLPIHQSGVSRHLRILSDSGFVQVRADGQRRLYSLRAEPFQQINSWMSRYRDLWEGRLDRFGAALEQRRSPRSRGRHS